MKFLTRELFEYQGRHDVPYEIRVVPWLTAVDARLAHLERIKPQLPLGMRAFCDITLHDGRIQSAHRSSPEDLVLEVDSRGCPWGPRGRFSITFRGVKDVEGLDECVGTQWLYEEVHLHPKARFEYFTLLQTWGWDVLTPELLELRVVADEVEFQLADPSPPPVIGVDIPFSEKNVTYVWASLDAAGDRMGWCCIRRDGSMVAKEPSAEVVEKMRQFARGVGAIMPG